MKYFIIIFSGMLIATSTFAAQRLPKNWHDLYSSGDGWRVVCDNPRSNGSLIYFKTAEDEPRADDVIVRFLYSHRMGWLSIAPYEGQCTGGSVAIDGVNRFDLIGIGGYCTSAQGEAFATPEHSYKKRKPQPIGMFSEGDNLEIILTTQDDLNISMSIPLDGFADAYMQLEAGTTCGQKGIRW